MNELVRMGLVGKTTKRLYHVLREKIEAFIPPVAS
jgi:hypothetical protein